LKDKDKEEEEEKNCMKIIICACQARECEKDGRKEGREGKLIRRYPVVVIKTKIMDTNDEDERR
jgi:hypothetical protein